MIYYEWISASKLDREESVCANSPAPFKHLMTARDQNLLTALMLLGARITPDLESIRDGLILDSNPRQRIIALLCSAILEDSRLFTAVKGGALFNGVQENKWMNIRTSTFLDKNRMTQILEAVDPNGVYWPDLCHCSNLESWNRHGDCQGLVKSLLCECNIEYNMFDNFVQIDAEVLLKSLARCMLSIPGARVESLYAVLFSPDTLRAVADRMQTVMRQASQVDMPPEDLGTSLKLLFGFVSIFVGAGLVLGHTMSPHT